MYTWYDVTGLLSFALMDTGSGCWCWCAHGKSCTLLSVIGRTVRSCASQPIRGYARRAYFLLTVFYLVVVLKEIMTGGNPWSTGRPSAGARSLTVWPIGYSPVANPSAVCSLSGLTNRKNCPQSFTLRLTNGRSARRKYPSLVCSLLLQLARCFFVHRFDYVGILPAGNILPVCSLHYCS